MTRTRTLVLTVAAVAVSILVWTFAPRAADIPPPLPDLASTTDVATVASDVAARSNTLARARALEVAGDHGAAADLYAAEITAADDPLSAYARAGHARSRAMAASLRTAVRDGLRAFAADAADLGAKVFAALALLAAGWVIARRARRRPGIDVEPLRDHTGHDAGALAAHRLVEAVRGAERAHRAQDGVLVGMAEDMTLPAFGLAEPLSTAAAEGLASAQVLLGVPAGFDVGAIAGALRTWWLRRDLVLAGDIFVAGDILDVAVELRDRRDGAVRQRWARRVALADASGGAPANVPLALQHALDDMAGEILFVLGGARARGRRSFALFTTALRHLDAVRDAPDRTADLAAAEAALRAALDADPGYALARYHLGLMLDATGRHPEAADTLRPLVLETDERAPGDDRVSRAARYALGMALLHHGQDWAYRQAAVRFGEVIDDVQPSNPRPAGATDPSLLALAHAGLAAVEAMLCERDAAHLADHARRCADHAAAARAARPGAPEIEAALRLAEGTVRLVEGAYAAAVTAFTAAVTLQPGHALANVRLAQALERAGRGAEARAWLERAVRYCPGSAYAQFQLGEWCRRNDDQASAIAAYRNAPTIALAQCRLGEVHEAAGDAHAAIAAYRAALDVNNRLARAHRQLALALAGVRASAEPAAGGSADSGAAAIDANAALAHAQRAVDLSRDDPPELWRSQDTLGWLLCHAGRLPEAIAALRHAVAADPTVARCRVHLALALRAAGDPAGARQALIEMYAAVPDVPQVWRARADELMRELRPAST